MYRGADLAASGRIDLGDDANNIRIEVASATPAGRYRPQAHCGHRPLPERKIAKFPVPAHPESFQLDHATGRIFVNVPKVAAIVVIDGLTGSRPRPGP